MRSSLWQHRVQADDGRWVFRRVTHPAQLLLSLPPSMVKICAFNSFSARTAGDSSVASDCLVHEEKLPKLNGLHKWR